MEELEHDAADITVRDLRRATSTARPARRSPAWDWDDEVAAEHDAQLEELRERVMELEVLLERARDGEAHVRVQLARLARAGRRERRRIVAEMRASGLVDG